MNADSSRDSDPQLDELVSRAYEQLRDLAHAMLHQRWHAENRTTSLVHEAYLRLSKSEDLSFNDKTHFMRIAARAMRQFLIDRARRSTAVKRGGGRRTFALEDAFAESLDASTDLLDLDDALRRLSEFDRRKSQIVELRFFAGCSLEQTAGVLQVSLATVSRDWDLAKSWIYNELRDTDAD